jgi:hypothetical protein
MEPEGSLPHYNSPPPVPILSQINTVHTLHPTSWKSILILPSPLRLGLPSDLFPSGFRTKSLYTPLLYPIRATRSDHLIGLDLITRTIFGEQYRSLSSSLCSFLHSPLTSYHLGPNILLNTLFSNILSLRSSLNVSDHYSTNYTENMGICICTEHRNCMHCERLKKKLQFVHSATLSRRFLFSKWNAVRFQCNAIYGGKQGATFLLRITWNSEKFKAIRCTYLEMNCI